jgi:hypothetical protein
MTVQSDLADWLAKLLRLACCETAPDGERLAALNRLSATVAAHDVDWDAALSGFNEEQLRRVFDEGYQRGHADGRQQAHPARDWTPAAGTSAEAGSDAKRIWAIVEASERAIGLSLLSDWEITFLKGIAERFSKYRARMYVSQKQWAVLDRLEASMRQYGILIDWAI